MKTIRNNSKRRRIAMAAAAIASAGGLSFVGAASADAHTATLTSSVTCVNGQQVITWKDTNNWDLALVATVTGSTPPPAAISPTTMDIGVSPASADFTQSVAGSVKAATVTVSNKWSDNYVQVVPGYIALPGNCVLPPPVVTTTTTTPPPPPAAAPSAPPANGTILVQKFSTTGTPLAGAGFEVIGLAGLYYTDSTGTVQISVPPGTYGVQEEIAPAGYTNSYATDNVTVTSGQSVDASFTDGAAAPVVQPAVNVPAELAQQAAAQKSGVTLGNA